MEFAGHMSPGIAQGCCRRAFCGRCKRHCRCMPPPRSDWPSWIPCTILSFQPKLPAACWISPAVLTPWRYTSAALHPCGAVISTRDWGCHHPFAREKDWDFTFALQDVLCAPPAEAGDLALILSFCPCWSGSRPVLPWHFYNPSIPRAWLSAFPRVV